MNPFSLLTKGKTVKGLKSRSGSYKLLGGNPLPNFSSPKHAPVAAPQIAAGAVQKALFELAQPAAIPPAPETPAKTLPAPPSPAPVAPAQAQKPCKPAQPGGWDRFRRMAAAWFLRCLPKRKAAAATTFQTELALEKVTVIRNDLNEDDLEIVVGQQAEKKTRKAASSEKMERENLAANP